MNLLVTGGAGFIGSNLVQHLIEQTAINILVNLDCLTYAGQLSSLDAAMRHPKYVFEKVDLRNKAEVFRVVQEHGITHVIHLAAESHVDRSISGPEDFIHTNIVGTFNLLEACRASWFSPNWLGTRSEKRFRFHHVSTDEVYGSLGPNGYFSETTPYAPNSPYSASKAASDLIVRSYYHTYGLPTVITNCSNNYGPYQFPEKLIPLVIQKLLDREPIPVYGDGSNVRDWLFVRDHCDAIWQVMTRGREGQTYNVGGKNEWKNIQIVGLICDIFDELKPDLGCNSRQLITFVKDRPGHDWRYAIDSSKIEKELGWFPRNTFENGIRYTVQWYLNNQEWINLVVKKKVDSKPAA